MRPISLVAEKLSRQAGGRVDGRRTEAIAALSEGGGGGSRPPDRAPLRGAVIVGSVALALIVGFGLGRAVDGDDPTANAPSGSLNPGGSAHVHLPGGAAGDPQGGAGGVAGVVGGLAVSSGAYTLVLATTTMTAGVAEPVSFRIDGPAQRPVTTFALVHDRRMHLVVVRRDLSGYQHLHPTMAGDGTWQVELALPTPGIWRVYADFSVIDATGAARALTLGADLPVAGEYAPIPLPPAARVSTVDDYTVTYEGTPQANATRALVFRVFRAGVPEPNLERYLGAYGHLVALREGDLAYVHVHPEDRLFRGAAKFWLSAPSPGRYRMFFEFQVGATVRVAPYSVVVS